MIGKTANYNKRGQMENREQKVSKVTEILIHKIHGGRKKDSKFWNSEYEIQNQSNSKRVEKKKNRNNRKSVINPIYGHVYRICGIIFIVGFWIYYFQNHKNNSKENVSKQTVSSEAYMDNSYKPTVRNQRIIPQIKKPVPSQQIPTKRPPSHFSDNSQSTRHKIYSWEDADGKLHFSNTGYPGTGKYTPKSVE